MASITQFSLLSHPYEELVPVTGGQGELRSAARFPGSALIWTMSEGDHTKSQAWVAARPGGLALIAILPRASDVNADPDLIQAVQQCRPLGLLPHHTGPVPRDLAQVLRCPPLDLAADIADYLVWRGLLVDRDTIHLVRRIIELSAEVRSISALSRRLYLSRRALGRHLLNRGLPVPSHWLQLARLLRLVARLQNSDANIISIAYEFGYPDGFSVSNQMHRLIGYRPTQARECLGWEWIFEAWLRREAEGGGLALDVTRAIRHDGEPPRRPPTFSPVTRARRPKRRRPLV